MDARVMDFILVGSGGIIGAITRFAIGIVISASEFPLSTLIVNVIGSFLLGFLVSLHEQERVSHSIMLFFGVGIMGSLTTMSTFGVETIDSGSYQLSTLNIIISLSGVLIGVILGKLLATLI